MGSTIIKIFSGEHASEPPKTALAQILGEGAFFVSRGAFLGLAPPYENSCGRPCVEIIFITIVKILQACVSCVITAALFVILVVILLTLELVFVPRRGFLMHKNHFCQSHTHLIKIQTNAKMYINKTDNS